MAFATTIHTFQRIGPQNDLSPTHWSYTSADGFTTMDGSGYFNAVAGRLKVGDVIWAFNGTATAFTYVKSNSAGVVNCPNFTLMTTTDSD